MSPKSRLPDKEYHGSEHPGPEWTDRRSMVLSLVSVGSQLHRGVALSLSLGSQAS